jgi:hypothetical protein
MKGKKYTTTGGLKGRKTGVGKPRVTETAVFRSTVIICVLKVRGCFVV